VTALPAAMVQVSVEEELDAARAWAARHNWTLIWVPDELLLRASTYHAPVRHLVEVTARCESYRALPPLWSFVQPGTDNSEKKWYPTAGENSIFHSNGLICAPWNRLAYSDHGGPHNDWSGPAAWLQVRNVSVCHSIPDMLASIDHHLRRSPGMMS
jgi:hypothetical protein